MRITELRITHFGKLHNVNISFGGGINLVEGPNESGKSTVHAFISAMLFGNERSRGRAAKDDAYVRYQPWDTPGAYQGSMDFEHKGALYRIERVFYQKERSCTLTELETGRQIKLPDEKITSFIPELTENAYRNTVSAMQLHVRTDSALAGEVRNYIANLSMTGDSEVDVSLALDSLNTKKKQLEGSLETARIAELQRLIGQDRLQEERMDKMARRLRELEEELRASAGQLEAMTGSEEYRSCKRAGEFPVAAERFRHYMSAQQELENCRRRILEVRESIAEAERQNDGEKQLKQEHSELISKNYEFGGGIRRNMQQSVLLVIIGAVIFAVAISVRATAVAVAALAVLIIASGALMARGIFRERKLRRELYKLEEERRRRLTEIDNLLRACSARRAALEQLYRQLCEYEKELAGREEQCEARRLDLMSLLSGYDREPQLTTEYIDALGARLSAQCESTARRENELRERISILENQAAPLRWELEHYAEREGDAADREQELTGLLERQEAVNEELEAVSMAVTTIKGLAASIHDVFGRKLNRALSKAAAVVTDGAYTEAVTDENLNIRLMGGTGFVPLEKLSAGTVEQIFFALRLSVADIFFEDIQMVLILDESFAYFDDARLLSALRYLVRERTGQIIMFTCHDRERRLLEGMGAEFNLIRQVPASNAGALSGGLGLD